jgi:hypothetical protein
MWITRLSGQTGKPSFPCWSILDLARLLGECYPELEVMTVNQHLAMRSLKVALPCRLFELLPLPERSVLSELEAFRQTFAF